MAWVIYEVFFCFPLSILLCLTKQMNVGEVKNSVQDGFKKSPTALAEDDLKEIALNKNVWKRVVHDVTRGLLRPDGG